MSHFYLAKVPHSVERFEVNLEKIRRQTWLWKLPKLSLLLIPCFCRLFKESLLFVSFWMNAWNWTYCMTTKLHIQIPIKSCNSLMFLETTWALPPGKFNYWLLNLVCSFQDHCISIIWGIGVANSCSFILCALLWLSQRHLRTRHWLYLKQHFRTSTLHVSGVHGLTLVSTWNLKLKNKPHRNALQRGPH